MQKFKLFAVLLVFAVAVALSYGMALADMPGDAENLVSDDADVQTVNNVSVAPGPDLTGTVNTFTSAFGREISGTVKVKNKGNQAAGDFLVAFYISNDCSTLPKKAFQKSFVAHLDANKSVILGFKYDGKTVDSIAGKCAIAVIDSANQVAETNETNNKVVFPVIPTY